MESRLSNKCLNQILSISKDDCARKAKHLVLKLLLSGKSDVRRNFSLVFEKRHDVQDSASCDYYVLSVACGSGRVQKCAKLAGRIGSGYVIFRDGSGRKIWTRVQL